MSLAQSPDVPLPAALRAQITQMTPADLPGFAQGWLNAMADRSPMVRLAHEVDVTRCDASTFATVLRSAKSYADLDFMAVAAAVRERRV